MHPQHSKPGWYEAWTTGPVAVRCVVDQTTLLSFVQAAAAGLDTLLEAEVLRRMMMMVLATRWCRRNKPEKLHSCSLGSCPSLRTICHPQHITSSYIISTLFVGAGFGWWEAWGPASLVGIYHWPEIQLTIDVKNVQKKIKNVKKRKKPNKNLKKTFKNVG